MGRKYSMAHLGCLNWTPAEMIYCAKAIGYDYVSIRTISMGAQGEVDYDFGRHPELFQLTKEAMEETGVGIHDVELAKICDERDVREYEPAFEAAAKLQVHHVISSIWTDRRDFYLDQFARVCDLAAQYDMTVSLEFVTWATIWNMQQAREVLETVNRPNAGILVDTLHAYRSRVAPEEIAACPKEWFPFAHVCGGPKEIPDRSDTENLIFHGREARYYLTEDANGIDAASYLAPMGPDTVYSLELGHWERARKWGTFEHQRRVLETTKTYMRQHGLD